MSSAIDKEALQQLKELSDTVPGDNLLKNLIDLFNVETPKRIQEIKRAFEAKDFPNLTLAAHSLKSGSAYLGAMKLSEISKTIEHSSTNNEIPPEMDKLIEGLEKEYTEASQYLNTQVAA